MVEGNNDISHLTKCSHFGADFTPFGVWKRRVRPGIFDGYGNCIPTKSG